MKKLLGTLLVLLMFSFGFGCTETQYSDGKYDLNYGAAYRDAEKLNRIFRKSIVTYNAKGEFKLHGEESMESQEWKGVGFSLDGKHLITRSHITSDNIEIQMYTPMGPIRMTIKAKKLSFSTEDGKELKVKRGKNDISLLYGDGVTFPILPVEVGNSDELEVGQALFILGYPENRGFLVNKCSVGNTEGWDSEPSVTLPTTVQFLIDGPVIPGDSGCPVFVLRDGKLELIGIATGVYITAEVGIIHKINDAMKHVGEILKD